MSAHTPGPWKIGPRNAGNGANISDSHGRYLAHTSAVRNLNGDHLDPERHIETAEAVANAHLIAAAPDLLAALRAARRQMTNQLYNKPRIGMEVECAMADAAIAKAEGKS